MKPFARISLSSVLSSAALRRGILVSYLVRERRGNEKGEVK